MWKTLFCFWREAFAHASKSPFRVSFLFMLTKGSHACRGLYFFFFFFTLRKDQLGAEVNEIGHPACISCQQPTVAAVKSSEVTVGQHQPPDRIRRLFTTCLREMETKQGGRCALGGEFCHVTRSKQHCCHWKHPFLPLQISPWCCAFFQPLRSELKTKCWP